MEPQTAAQPPCDPSSAAAYPRWVMLQKDLKIQAERSSRCTPCASETLAAARASTGHLIQVSLCLTEPPGVSCVCLQIPDAIDAKCSTVVAAHGDSVLIEVSMEEKDGNRIDHLGYPSSTKKIDHFVYNAGAAAADPPRPPSLLLLPLLDPDSTGTGLMRRGEDELVVAQLTVVPTTPVPETPELKRVAELSLFRHGEWSVKSLQIRFRNDSEAWAWEYRRSRSWNAVIPVGDGLLCWVDLEGLVVVLCDVLEETPRLQFRRLPRDSIQGPRSNRNVCATAAGDALKFINIFPRCCCGEAGAACGCKRSRHAYTIHTWTMRIDGGAMEWVMDGVVDATELWALNAYKGLQCLPLVHPVLSLDEPDLICFWLHKPLVDKRYWIYTYRSADSDLLMVNMRTKTIHSVSRHRDGLLLLSDGPIPSNVSYFFNSYPSGSGDGTLTGQRKKGIERQPPAIVDKQLTRIKRRCASITTDPMLQPASFDEPSVNASEIFEAFQEIPSYGLDHDEIIKAYGILSRDNGLRFRSFIRLPKNVRKDWLLVEIKASD